MTTKRPPTKKQPKPRPAIVEIYPGWINVHVSPNGAATAEFLHPNEPENTRQIFEETLGSVVEGLLAEIPVSGGEQPPPCPQYHVAHGLVERLRGKILDPGQPLPPPRYVPGRVKV